MNREAIVKALEVALDKTSDFYKSTMIKASQLPEETREGLINHTLSDSVTKILETQEEFVGPIPFTLHTDGMSYAFSAQIVAPLLIRKARKTNDPELAVDWLENVLTTKKATGYKIITLWGITVTENVQLTQNAYLIPIKNLPESKMKDKVLDVSFERFDRPNIPLDLPETALIYKVIIDPFLSNKTNEDKNSSLRSFSHREEMIKDILLGLTLVGPCSPIRYFSWFQFEDQDLEDARLGQNYGFSFSEIIPMTIWEHEPVEPKVAEQIISQYLQLEGKTKKKVQIALERLNQAMRRSNVGDKALEISIALESILSDGMSENTYKIGLRSSLILGGDLTQMLHMRAIVGGTSILRNALVHNGEVKETVEIVGEGKKNSKVVVDEAINICAKILNKIVEKQIIPNWFEFELTKT